MALLPIIYYGNPLLKKKSKDVKEIDDEILNLIDDMFDTMYEEGGVGLAAVQVGKLLNLFILNTTYDPDKNEDGTEEVFINPKIIKTYGKVTKMEEGCLSVPDLKGSVSRKSLVDIEYIDINGEKKVEEEVLDLRSKAIQHESDHLNGMLYIDRLSTTKRLFLKSELNSIAEEYND